MEGFVDYGKVMLDPPSKGHCVCCGSRINLSYRNGIDKKGRNVKESVCGYCLRIITEREAKLNYQFGFER